MPKETNAGTGPSITSTEEQLAGIIQRMDRLKSEQQEIAATLESTRQAVRSFGEVVERLVKQYEHQSGQIELLEKKAEGLLVATEPLCQATQRLMKHTGLDQIA